MFLFVAFSTPCLAPIVATLSLVPGVPRTSSARRTHYPIEKIVGDSSSAKIALYYSTAACFREAIRHCCPPDMNLNLVEFPSAISGDAAGQTLRRLLAALEMFVSPDTYNERKK